MHQGNLFVDPQGALVAVDFGIMGRLTPKERLFLAEILYGFIRRDYMRVSLRCISMRAMCRAITTGALFAQALRAIGEPIMDRPADEISMARLLTQLFEVTGQFDMQTQPQLLLLQKTMVVVEGVARTLNPQLNMWATSEPVVREWIETQARPARAARGGGGRRAVARAPGDCASRGLGGGAERRPYAVRHGPFRRHQARPGNDRGIGRGPGPPRPADRYALWIAAGAMLGCCSPGSLIF